MAPAPGPAAPLVRPAWQRLTWWQRFRQEGTLGRRSWAYARLCRQLRARTDADLAAWDRRPDPEPRLARDVCRILADQLGWPHPRFLPDDHADVLFDAVPDDMAAVEAILAIEEHLGTAVPEDLWATLDRLTFGDLVHTLAAGA